MTRIFSRLTMLFLILFGLVGSAMAQDAYLVRRGDTLRIEVLEDSSLNRSVLVYPDGRISVPLAGAVMAAGTPIEAVQRAVAEQLAPNFASTPTVFISIERLAERRPAGEPAPAPTIEIYVLGEVGNQGKLVVAPGTTILEMFSQVGGFSRFAATTRIQLRRLDSAGVEQIYNLNYDAIEAGTDGNGRTTLLEGDIIVVPQRRLFE